MPRKLKLKQNDSFEPCPKCGNNTEFTAYSEQVAEDSCDVWVVCKCGYDPTAENTLYRYEDVWGGTDNGNCFMALECWNDAIQEMAEKQPKEAISATISPNGVQDKGTSGYSAENKDAQQYK